MTAELTPISLREAAARALAAQEGGEPVGIVTVVSAPDPEALGRRLLVSASGVQGRLADGELDAYAAELARKVLAGGEHGTTEVSGPGGRWELYVEAHRAVPELLIVGAGHIARPLCELGAVLGFRVTVVDDRPEYADRKWFPGADRVAVIDFADPFAEERVGPDSYIVLVTRGHKYDYDCVEALLRMEAQPAYLGMIGSRRRVRAAFEALLADGVDPQRLESVHAPIGLDIGAETPAEIALAIAAEIVAVRRGGRVGGLSAQERVLARVSGRRERERKPAENG